MIIDIKDNVELASFKVYMADKPGELLAEGTEVGKKQFVLKRDSLGHLFNLDLHPYSPVPESGKKITLVVEVSDSSGNRNVHSEIFDIEKDQPPRVSISALVPPVRIAQGGIGQPYL